MTKCRLIGKIFGIALVLVISVGMFGGLSSTVVGGADQTVAPGDLTYSPPRQLARSSDGVFHCVYSRSDVSYSQIYYSYSTDGGESWTEEPITAGPYRYGNPSIAIDSNDNIHVVWDVCQGTPGSAAETCAIQYRVKTTVWQPIQDVINNQSCPSIAIDSNNVVHLVVGGYWGGAYSAHYVRYMKRTYLGWGVPEIVSSSGWANYPALAIDEIGNIHVVYIYSPRYGAHYGLRYRVRNPYVWGSEEIIQSDDLDWSPGSIALDSGGNVYVVYYLGWYSASTGATPGPIKMSKRTSTGWQPAKDVYPTDGYPQLNPTIAIDSDDYLHVVWQGKHSGSPNQYQIRYRRYTTVWSTIQNLTSASVDQESPKLVWAWWPIVDGIRTNRLEQGYAFIWNDASDIKFCTSFHIGDTVKVDTSGSTLNMHQDSPTCDIIRVVPDGWTLEIINGPQYDILGHDWWEVRESQYENEPLVEGWVEEDYLKEVSPATLIPDSTPEYFNSASAQVEAAIARAESKEGSLDWANLCLRFVEKAFGVENIGWGCPQEGIPNCPMGGVEKLANEGKFYSCEVSYNPPRGSLIFFSGQGSDPEEGINYTKCGHIGIYLGSGEVIHAYGKVKIQNLTGSQGIEEETFIDSYIGWAYPPRRMVKQLCCNRYRHGRGLLHH